MRCSRHSPCLASCCEAQIFMSCHVDAFWAHRAPAGAMGVPVPERIPGDCYVWGSSEAAAGGKSAISSPVPGWQHSNLPILVENTTHLDVLQVPGVHPDAHPAVSRPTAAHSLLCMAHLSAYAYCSKGHHLSRVSLAPLLATVGHAGTQPGEVCVSWASQHHSLRDAAGWLNLCTGHGSLGCS